MSEKVIREQLLDLLRGGNAHAGFEEAVDGFPHEFFNRKAPRVPYTFWHLLEHMRIAQLDILEFIRDPDYVSPDWPDGFWPPPKEHAEKRQWKKTIDGFIADRSSLEQIITDPDTDFFAPIPHAKDYNIFREVLVVADHTAYHIGEFLILRQVVGIGE